MFAFKTGNQIMESKTKIGNVSETDTFEVKVRKILFQQEFEQIFQQT